MGTGTGSASVVIADEGNGKSSISYEADGDVGGLVAGVGQRVLMGVAKHLTRQFFTSLKKQFTNPSPPKRKIATGRGKQDQCRHHGKS